jgi:hypothetical protein
MNSLRRSIAILFYPVFLAAVSFSAIAVVGVSDAVGIAAAALAWFVFGRLLVNVIVAAAFHGTARSHRLPMLIGSFIVDAAGCVATMCLDTRLILIALIAIGITELAIWSMEFLEPASIRVAR